MSEYVLYLFVSCLAIVGICYVKRNDRLKKAEGKLISGKKISDISLMGRPTRYMVEVEYLKENVVNRRKIITTDRNIVKCKNDENISLIYVEKNDKVYWAEEKSVENVIIILLLVVTCIFTFLLAIIKMAV